MTDAAGKSWYSGYKSAIVGSPRSPWAAGQSPEDEVRADDVNGDVFLPDETKPPEKTAKPSDGDPGKTTIDQNNNETEALKRVDHDGPPASMEFPDLETDHTRRPPRRAFWASFSEEVDDEHYQPIKRYEKPPEKIQRSMSARVYIVGGSTDNHCKACGGRLYEMEKVIADRCSYHRHCFRCTQCQRILSLANYISVDGQPHCKSHFKELIVGKPTKAAPTGQTTATAARTDKTIPSQPTTPNGLQGSSHHVMTSSKPIGDETTVRRPIADDQPGAASLRIDVQVPKTTRFETDVTDASRPNDGENSRRSGVGIASFDRNEVRPERRSDAQSDATKVNKRVRFSDDLTSVYRLPFTQLESSVDPPNFPDKVSFLEVQLNVAPNRATNLTGPLPSADTERRHAGSRDDEVQLPSVAGVLAKFESLEVGPARDVPGPTRKIIRRMTPFHMPPQVSGSGDSDEDEPRSDDKKESEKELGVRDGSHHPAFRGNHDSRIGVDGVANGSDRPDGHRGPEANVRMSGHVDLLTSSVKGEERDSDDDDDDDDWRNAKTVDLPEPGLTRTLLTHWKTLEQGSTHEDRQRSSWTAGTEPGAADARYASLHAEPPNRPVVMTRSLSTPTGFGSGIETLRRSSLGFTRNRLAKFRHLEAMNLEKSSGPVHHKNFKWGVKEPNFLHKPVTLSSASPHPANPHPAPPSVLPPSSHVDHHEPATSGDGEPLRRTTDDEPPHLEDEDACSVENMRRALERFRSMEDPTLPPPTPTTTGTKRVSGSGTADGKAMGSATLNGY